jgi:hypothetical protein
MPDRLEKVERQVAKGSEQTRCVDITNAKGTYRITVGENGRAIGSPELVPTSEVTPATTLRSYKVAILIHALWRMENFPDKYPTFRPALVKGREAGPLKDHDPKVFAQACKELLAIADDVAALGEVYGYPRNCQGEDVVQKSHAAAL